MKEKWKEINGYDGYSVSNTDKSNNKVSNLEWSTSSENTIHAYKNGLYDNLKKIVIYIRT